MGESGPKHYSCQLLLDWHQTDIVQWVTPTFWYNRTNDGKGTKNLVQMRLISYGMKMETFMLVADFRYACLTHTYIFTY